MRDLEVVALEAAASRVSPLQRWRPADRKPKGAFDLVARGSRRAFLKRIEARSAALLAVVLRDLPGASLVRPMLADGVVWRTRFAATFPLASIPDFKRWVAEAQAIGERLRRETEEGEDLILVPLLNGRAAIDHAYQLSRADDNSMFGAFLRSAGQTSLLAAPETCVVSRLDAAMVAIPPELGEFLGAARDLHGLITLRLACPERPKIEQQCLDQALADMNRSGRCLLQLFDGIDHSAARAMRSYIEGVLASLETGEPPSAPSQDAVQDAVLELVWRQSRDQR